MRSKKGRAVTRARKSPPGRAAKAAGKGVAKTPRRRNAPAKPVLVEAVLAAFAHEVRTPLTGILAVGDLLATAGLRGRERQWVEMLKASAEHLAALTTLFVDGAKSRRSALVLRRDVFDLGAVTQAAAQSLAARATAKGLVAKIKIAPALSQVVIADAVRLRAALENLIDNAVKFTNRGRVGLRATLARRAGGRLAVTFAVSDSGVGLTEAERKRLFRPFSQGSVATAGRFGGAGLGLASVRQLARAMGGDVAVTSKSRGAVFSLRLMVEQAGEVDAAPARASVERARAKNILCVEDNPFARVVLNTLLTELGHRTDFVGRGEEAIAALEAAPFDAVLMDMVLPGIDGIETIRRIRAAPALSRRLIVIGVSGRAEDEAAARAAGADGFLVKPVSPRALAKALAG